MMRKLLEQLLQTKPASFWLTPDGDMESALPDHATDAAKRLSKFTGEPEIDYYDTGLKEIAYSEFMKISGYVRVYLSSFSDEMDVSVGSKVTSTQLVKIGKLAREYPKFYWDIYNPWKKETKSKSGAEFREFINALKSQDLLEARGHWRDWTEISCPECRWRTYRKTLRKSDPKGILKTMKCPECEAALKLEESSKDLLEKILEDVIDTCPKCRGPLVDRGTYLRCWDCGTMVDLDGNLIEEPPLEESSIDFPRKDMDLSVWDKKDNAYLLKDEVKKQIIDLISKYPDKDLKDIAEEIHIVGSIGTNLFQDSADIDVHIIPKNKDNWTEEGVNEVRKWFNEHRDELDGYINEHPIEIDIQLDINQDLMSDGCYNLLNDEWLVGPKVVPMDFDPYEDFSHIADDIKSEGEDADALFGELKRDVIDYEVIHLAMERMSGEDKERLLQKLQSKLNELEDDIEELFAKRKDWVDKRHNAAKPTTPEQALKDVDLAKRWKDTNATFKFIDRYKYLKTIKDLQVLLSDEEISPDEIDKIKSIMGV